MKRKQWHDMEPLGRAGVALGVVSTILAIVGSGLWIVTAEMMAANDQFGFAWQEYKTNNPNPYPQYVVYFRALDILRVVIWISLALGIGGLACALLNANKQQRPQHHMTAITSSACGLSCAIIALLMTTSR